MTHGPLTGTKMIECTTWGFGPIGGMMLGDLGAEIVHVETRERLDIMRGYPPYGAPAGPDRSFADMINYLRWEERLGHKYASPGEP